MLQSVDGRDGTVGSAKAVAGDQDGLTAVIWEQIQHGQALSDRHQHTSGAFDEHTHASAGQASDPPQNSRQATGATVPSGGSQRGKRCGNANGRTHRSSILHAERRWKIRICLRAGRERLDGQRVATALPAAVAQQSRDSGPESQPIEPS